MPQETPAQKRARLKKEKEDAEANDPDAASAAAKKKQEAVLFTKLQKDAKDALQRYSNTVRQANHLSMQEAQCPEWKWAATDQEYNKMKDVMAKISHDVITSGLLSQAVSVDWAKLKPTVGSANYRAVLQALIDLKPELQKVDTQLRLVNGNHELRLKLEADRLQKLQKS